MQEITRNGEDHERHYARICDWNFGALRNDGHGTGAIEHRPLGFVPNGGAAGDRKPADGNGPGKSCRSARPGGRNAGYFHDEKRKGEGLQQGRYQNYASECRIFDHRVREAPAVRAAQAVLRRAPFGALCGVALSGAGTICD